MKCIDYIKRDDIQGYIKPEQREATQLKPLMGFKQEY